jgi:hypothetical protein
MDNIELHTAHSGGEGSSPSVYSPALQPLMQSLLSVLADIDFAYEREHESVSRSIKDVGLKTRLLERLRERHCERREPYAQQLTILQDQIRRASRHR